MGAMKVGDDGEEILTRILEDASEPAADEVGDSLAAFFFQQEKRLRFISGLICPAREEAPETEALTLTNSAAA